MRFQRITIRDIEPFAGEHTFDLEKLDGTVTSVMGPNGSGKTTLVELFFAGVYRTLITRGSKQHTLASLATSRESFLEVVANGYTFRHLIDGTAGKGEAVVLSPEGEPLTSGSGVASFDRWVAENMPAPKVVLSGIFSHQKSQGFVAASPGDRKSVLLQLLGVEKLQARAKQAREHHQAAMARHGEAKRALQVENDRGAAIVQPLRQKVEKTEARVQELEEQAERLTQERRQAAETVQLSQERQLEQQRWDAQNAQLRQALVHAEGSRDRCRREIGSLDQVLVEEAVIRRAVVDEQSLQAELDRCTESRQAMIGEHGQLKAELRGHEAELGAALKALQEAEHAEQMLEPERNRVRRLKDTAAELERKRGELETKTGELEALSESRSTDLGSRVVVLREALMMIVAHPIEAVQYAQACLKVDDDSAEQAERLPELVRAARQELRDLRLHMEQLGREAGNIHLEQERLDAVERQAGQVGELRVQHTRALGLVESDQVRLEELTGRGQENSKRLDQLKQDLAPVSKLARKLPLLESATQRIVGLKSERTEQDRLVKAHQAELEQMPERPSSLPAADLKSLESQLETAQADLRKASRDLGECREKLGTAEDSCVAGEELQELVAGHAEEARLWKRLALDLGRDGLQAAVVDAALPELTSSANDLLHSCFGTRFSVELATQRASSKGDKLLETLDVLVHDAEKGRVDAVETYSGGEGTIVSEAVALAIAQMTCSNAGLEGAVLVRDEAGAALDPTNGQQWVEMMRRAGAQVGASRVVFISHDPVCQALGDSRIVLGG